MVISLTNITYIDMMKRTKACPLGCFFIGEKRGYYGKHYSFYFSR